MTPRESAYAVGYFNAMHKEASLPNPEFVFAQGYFNAFTKKAEGFFSDPRVRSALAGGALGAVGGGLWGGTPEWALGGGLAGAGLGAGIEQLDQMGAFNFDPLEDDNPYADDPDAQLPLRPLGSETTREVERLVLPGAPGAVALSEAASHGLAGAGKLVKKHRVGLEKKLEGLRRNAGRLQTDAVTSPLAAHKRTQLLKQMMKLEEKIPKAREMHRSLGRYGRALRSDLGPLRRPAGDQWHRLSGLKWGPRASTPGGPAAGGPSTNPLAKILMPVSEATSILSSGVLTNPDVRKAMADRSLGQAALEGAWAPGQNIAAAGMEGAGALRALLGL